MLRKGGIIGILVVVVLCYFIALFFTNSWLESNIEDAGTSLNGALVEIDGLNLSFINAKLGWERLQVTNPDDTWYNSFETGKTEFDLEILPLLSGKFIVENAQLTEIKTNTKRETDGKVEKQEETKVDTSNFISETKGFLENNVKETTGVDLSQLDQKINVDSLLKFLDLKTPHKIDSLKTLYTERYEYWNTKIANTNPEKDIKQIESEIKKIKVNDIKSPEQVATSIRALKNTKDLIDSLKGFIETTQNDFNKDLKTTQTGIKEIPQWIQSDYNKALSKAKLPQMDAENIAKILFGGQMVAQVNKYLSYLETAREYSEYIPESEEKEPEPPRFEGQDIHFSGKYARPDFWVQKLNLSGETESGLRLEGLANDITSQQSLINKITTVNIKALAATRSFNLDGKLDYLTDIPKEMVKLDYKGISLNNTKIADTDIFPDMILEGIGDISASLSFEGEELNSGINFNSKALKFGKVTGNKSEKINQLVNDVVSNINNLKIDAKIYGNKNDLKFAVSSNIDKLFMNSFNNVLSKELSSAKAKIKSYVNNEINEYKSKLDNLIAENEKKITNKLNDIEAKLGVKTDLLENKNKELEKKKAELLKGAGGGILNIFGN